MLIKAKSERNLIFRHLIHDEIESMPSRQGVPHSFRIRIWAAKDMTPICLISQVRGDINPWPMIAKLANYVYKGLLRHHAQGCLFLYSESFDDCHNPIHFVHFEHFSDPCDARYTLYKPMAEMKDWDYMEMCVGQRVEQ